MLQIRLFGPFEIELDGQSFTKQDWSSQQTQTIAKILLTNRNKVVTSDQLIDILWPDESVHIARSRLHVRISQLRKSLREKSALLRTVHGGYIFEPDETCWVDADAFQSEVSLGNQHQEAGQQRQAIQAYENARQCYRGDFLAEDIYENWTFSNREFYRERYLSMLVQLSESYAQQGRYSLAINRAQIALNLDPLRETIYVRLILYYYYAGDRTQALSLFDRYSDILERELGIQPQESTLQLVEQIKNGSLWKNASSPHYPPPAYDGKLFEVPYALDEIPFVNREREYAWLVSQWKQPGKQVVLLEGEAGIGKSRLLDAFSHHITTLDVKVLQVRLTPDEQTPTATLTAALGELLTEKAVEQLSPAVLAVLAFRFPEYLKRITQLPELPSLPPQADRQRFYQAISALISIDSNQPKLLIIDDAHRLNATAVDLVRQLSTSIKILLSYRGEETASDHPLRRLFGSPGLILKPLPKKAIQSIIQQLSKEDHPFITDQISKHSQGNPLFVVTLLQHMFESGQLFINTRGKWELTDRDSPAMPLSLQETIEERLQSLDRGKRRIMDYAAVLGGQFDFDLLQSTSQQSEDILLTMLDELIDSGLIIEPRSTNQAEFSICHDYYTEVTYATIPAVRRKQMHLQAAQSIETRFAGHLMDYYTTLADHFDKAQKQETAAHYAILAGEQASTRFASDEALYYFERALAFLPSDEIVQRARVLLAREQVYDLNGLRELQKHDLDSLDVLSPKLPAENRAEIKLRRAALEWFLGNDKAAHKAVLAAIQLAQAANAIQIEARALLIAGKVVPDPKDRIKYLEQAQELARTIQQPALLGEIIRWLGNINFWQNNFEQTQIYFEDALKIHHEIGDIRGELSVLNNLGHLYDNLGQFQKGVQYFHQASEICQKIGDRMAEGVILTNLGGLLIRLGKFDQAQENLNKAVVVRQEINNDEGVAVARNYLGDVYRQRGDYQSALEQYQEAISINTRIGHIPQKGEALTGLSVLFRELGDYKQAKTYLEEAFSLLTDPNSPRFIRGSVEESFLAHLLGDPEKAIALGEQSLLKTKNLGSLQAVALKNIGHASLSLKLWEQAKQNYEKALSIFKEVNQYHLATEPLAGLAMLNMKEENLASAMGFVEEILDHIKDHPLQGPDRVLWIYLACYRVLHNIQDERALSVLKNAHTLMAKRATSIKEESLRISYLTRIPENIEISQIWGALQQSH